MKIVVCMGSSCFSRGNSRNLEAIQNWLREKDCEADVELKGCRCGEKCNMGPNIWLNDKCFSGVTEDEIPELLEENFR